MRKGLWLVSVALVLWPAATLCCAGCPRNLAKGRAADDLLGGAGAGKLEDRQGVVQAVNPVVLDRVPAGGERGRRVNLRVVGVDEVIDQRGGAVVEVEALAVVGG